MIKRQWLFIVLCCICADCHCIAADKPDGAPRCPFPQHTRYAEGTIKPDNVSQQQLDAAVTAFYDVWKTNYIVAGSEPQQFYVLVNDPVGTDRRTICVSEGQGYGLVITAFMAGHDPRARELFDGLFRFYRAHPSRINSRLMAWKQIKGGKSSEDADSASDGDLDIAFGLLLADTQWGSRGEINYRAEALSNIAAIKADEINRRTWSVKLGDWASRRNRKYYDTRPSDFMFDHFRSFRAVSGDDDWLRVIDTSYRVISRIQQEHSPSTGLIPDFVTSLNETPVPAKPDFLEGPQDGQYYYNSCRVPFRLAVDLLLTGEPRAKTALKKINTWIVAAAGGKPANIRAGYRLDGKKINPDDVSMAFTACFAVGAMSDAAYQEWLNALWDNVAASDLPGDRYYGRSLKMLCLIALSGNWWAPLQPIAGK